MKPLSKAQLAMLRRLNGQDELVPAGYPKAGADASRWWRTLAILEGKGFARHVTGTQLAMITAKGREHLTENNKP